MRSTTVPALSVLLGPRPYTRYIAGRKRGTHASTTVSLRCRRRAERRASGRFLELQLPTFHCAQRRWPLGRRRHIADTAIGHLFATVDAEAVRRRPRSECGRSVAAGEYFYEFGTRRLLRIQSQKLLPVWNLTRRAVLVLPSGRSLSGATKWPLRTGLARVWCVR